MKKLFFVFAVLIGISACSTDLTDIEDRIKKLEDQGKSLSDKSKKLEEDGKKLEEEGNQLQDENEKLQAEINRLKDSLSTVEPKLLQMEFLAADNPLLLVENAKCDIIGDSIVVCQISNVVRNKVLIPRFRFDGESVKIGSVTAESGVSQFDFSKPIVLSVLTPKKTKDYKVYVNSYTGLATLWIETPNHAGIGYQYISANLKLFENAVTRAAGDTKQVSGQVVCDNSSQGKCEYTLKFTNKVSFFSDPEGFSWALKANCSDITMLRSQTAYYMSKISNLVYTPRYHYIDLMLNGRYNGTYMMGECMEISDGRVNVGSDGFLMCVGAGWNGISFNASYLEQPVTIVAPASVSNNSINYISGYISSAETALFSSNFKDPKVGWQKYLDIDSFVDWYIVNEIAKNESGAFQSNCLMNLKLGAKLKMGPIYNLETAFNNRSTSNGFVVKNSRWYSRLFQDPVFVAKVKERFVFFYTHKKDIISEMNNNAQYLKYSVQENDNKWNVFATATNTWAEYQKTVVSLELWLNNRIEWLKEQFDKMS